MCKKNVIQKPEGKNHLEDLGTEGRTVLKWMLKKQCGRVGTGLWLRVGMNSSQ
jgi:hypothetical protein